MILVTAAEMRALDRWTIDAGTPGHVLMERAGAGATRVLRDRLRAPHGGVVVLAGRGNNGGDGFVIARHLRKSRMPVEVWLAGRVEDVRGDAARMLAAWRKARGKILPLTDAAHVGAFTRRLTKAAVVVDALFGTGLNAPVTGVAAAAIEAVNASGAPVLAVDVASGLSADTGRPLGVAIRATVTATFGFPKLGQVLFPGAEHTGLLAVVDIGIPDAAVAAVRPQARLLEAEDVGRLLPPRRADAHKGTFGHVLVVAGSRGKSGAALLCAEAATRAGAGLVTLAVPAELQPVCEGHVREAMTDALPAEPGGISALLDGRSAVVCGPGLGQSDWARRLVHEVIRRSDAPLVLDADGLNAVAGTSVLRERRPPTVVTPHPGEMARLLDTDTAHVQADRVDAARRYARESGAVVVLKGARTVIATPDGDVAISPTGNPGMATGGTGDVLAGVVGALLAQDLAPRDAAALGVFAHGVAGDAVAARRGEVGLVARDLVHEMPPTFAALQGRGRPESPVPRGYRFSGPRAVREDPDGA
jgi:NAD(P)H-hydrate epimerase